MPINRSTEKKKDLLAYKEKILNDIKYYEKRINEDLLENASTPVNFEDSSDSDDECPFTIDTGPTVIQLESQQKMLQTGLHATQELASLMVLQSQVDVMVDDPVLNGEPPVTQPGSWKEVNADCRIDLVPFSTTFYVHKANGLFGAKSYRSLKLLPMKPAQEVELSRSVLTRVKTPSDALEVLRNYSVAYRSRRTTLAKLADKFAHNLHMEPMPAGGYIMKCVNLLEISWVLENKWSPIAPFYHKMIFDLENMDECYIKIIRYAHKQLGDPSTDTNMRTQILTKIITTCLEAQGTQELYESMESDKESVKSIEKRRQTLESEAPEPKKMRNVNQNDETKDGITADDINNKDNIDDQIMAPPKSLPKKAKLKGKENTDQNRKSAKRTAVANETSSVKKAKTDNIDTNNSRQREPEKDKAAEKDNHTKSKNNAKNKVKVTKSQNNTEKSAKSTEKVNQQKTNAEEKSDHNRNNNTETLKNKEKVGKEQNPKDIRNNEKELVKDSQKSKIVKSKNRDASEKSAKGKNDNQEENIDKVQGNRNVQSHEKTKKKVVTDADPQNVVDKDKIVARSNNDLIPKNPETQKVSSKNKIISSKNEPKVKNSEKQKVPTDKVSPTSKTDPKTKESKKHEEPSKEIKVVSPQNNIKTTENKAKNGIHNARLVEVDDIPIMSVNNTDKFPRKHNNIKTTKNHKGTSKSTINEKGQKKDQHNNKLANVESTNFNKDSNAQNVKKTIVNNTKSNNKPSADNAVLKNDKAQTNNANKAEPNTQKKIKSNDKNSENQHKTSKDTQKTITQNVKPPKEKDSDKKTVNKLATNDPKTKEKFNENNTASNKVNAENNREINENKQSKIVEKMAKISNVATKKEHTNIEKPIKIGDGKPKLAIKTLTHKQTTSKKVREKFNISSKLKNFNPGNIVKKPAKENDSGSKTKIPLKLSVLESLKKNPLRISPRKLPSSFKSSSDIRVKQKSHFTNIPRLLKKLDSKKISK